MVYEHLKGNNDKGEAYSCYIHLLILEDSMCKTEPPELLLKLLRNPTMIMELIEFKRRHS